MSKNPNTIKLQTPFTTDAGVPIEQVTVKPLVVRQMKTAQKQGGGDKVKYYCLLCNKKAWQLSRFFGKNFTLGITF